MGINIGWPEGIYLAIVFLSAGLHLGRHGEAINMKYNFWGRLIAAAALLGLLYWGGFFS